MSLTVWQFWFQNNRPLALMVAVCHCGTNLPSERVVCCFETKRVLQSTVALTYTVRGFKIGQSVDLYQCQSRHCQNSVNNCKLYVCWLQMPASVMTRANFVFSLLTTANASTLHFTSSPTSARKPADSVVCHATV